MIKKPVMLMILDGWGIAPDSSANAATRARTPNLTKLLATCPHTEIICSGEAVGLPEGQMGNSEVGHLNMGAGRIVYQELTRISKAIKDGDFFSNPALTNAMKAAKEKKSSLHLMGLLSDGGVHSHLEHLLALVRMAAEEGVQSVYIHAFLDGRDVGPKTALCYVEELEDALKNIGIGRIATVSGRYYAMDRDKRWERLEKAYKAIVMHDGKKAESAAKGIKASYDAGINDEFVEPFIIIDDENACVKEADEVVFFNFRPDRARQLTRAFVDKDFSFFKRPFVFPSESFVCMTQYDETIETKIAFPPTPLKNTLGEVLAKAGLHQLRIAETEKYAHVTFFFNGGEEVPNPLEDRVLVPSPKVATYDLQPEMSAYQVTDKLLEAVNKDVYDVIILNFANPDMVGHTGIFNAAVKAMETIDEVVGIITKKIIELEGIVCITADHGNLEKMQDVNSSEPCTSHTTNKVPFVLIGDKQKRKLRTGILADVAPTLLELLCLQQPQEMTGRSLLIK
ncbi:MAG: 2,3-bisphosphoglycerate-independent phosphoglycerate mutase [Acidaminococcaceae bacterium]